MTDLSQTALTDYVPAETGINESDDRHRRLLRARRAFEQLIRPIAQKSRPA
jgi:tmRNA-binding protein